MNLLWIALGGGLGSAMRYVTINGVRQVFGDGTPWGTTLVNVAGSFVMGLLGAWFMRKAAGDASLQLFLTTGFLGGFTTFSAFSQDLMSLLQRAEYGTAAIYALASVGLSLAACFAGFASAQHYG